MGENCLLGGSQAKSLTIMKRMNVDDGWSIIPWMGK